MTTYEPDGFLRLLRTVPVLRRIAEAFRQEAIGWEREQERLRSEAFLVGDNLQDGAWPIAEELRLEAELWHRRLTAHCDKYDPPHRRD